MPAVLSFAGNFCVAMAIISGEASPIFSHAMQMFVRSKTVKTINF